MKYNVAILIIIILSFTNHVYSQTDTTLQKLLNINYTAYNGHTVDSLVRALPTGILATQVSISHRADYGDVLSIKYPNDVYVEINVTQFRYMNPWLNKTNRNLSPTVNWDVNLFRKEKIAYTIVYAGVACKAGCENDPQATAP